MTPPTPMTNGFDNLGIAPKLLEILTKNKFTTPTPIQAQSIPVAVTGKDIMGIAQTGTGKTLAFGVPMIQRLAQSGGQSRGLVVLPTRELALQVNETLRKIGGSLGLKTAILIGGESMNRQLSALKQNPHIIIATPGRLIDHIENGRLKLNNMHILVLDEADRMLDMGFAPQIKKILQQVPKQRQTMLFSATMPNEIMSLAHSFMSLPLRIEVAPAGTAVKTVTQELFFVEKNDKPHLLRSVLMQYTGSVLVFSRTKFGAKKIAHMIRDMGETADEIHSNRSLNQRIAALNGFKIGKYRILVATDIAARGIDVTGIQLVLNYDLPSTAEDYVHRIGRTGRAGLAGHAISFATPDQRGDIRGIERLIRTVLPVSKTPTLEKSKLIVPRDDERERRPSFNRPRSNDRFQSRGQSRPSSPSRSGGSSRPSGPSRHSGSSRPPSRDSNYGSSRPRTGGGRKRSTEYSRQQEPRIPRMSKPSAQGQGFFISKAPTPEE